MPLSDITGRLKAIAGDRQHDFRPSTNLFPDPNFEQLVNRHQLTKRGKEKGEKNDPPTSATTSDTVEQEIIGASLELRNGSRDDLNSELETFAARLADLDFDGLATKLELETRETITNFQAKIAEDHDILHRHKTQLVSAEKELRDFRATHKLNRDPWVLSRGQLIFRVGIVLVIALIETFGNTALLAKGNELGILGAAVEALVLAVLNVGFAWLSAVYAWRAMNRISLGRKAVGFILAVMHLVLAIILNLGIAHYRDISGTLIDDAGAQVVQRILQDPLGLDDFVSWSLFGLGILFAVITMIDTYGLGDPYPEFGQYGRRKNDAREEFEGRKLEVFDELGDFRDETNQEIKETAELLNSNVKELRRINESRKRVIQRFQAHETAIENCANRLITHYREANQQARSTKPPKFFNSKWELERADLPDGESFTSIIEKSETKFREATEIAKHSMDEINREYKEAYSKLDLIDDVVVGQEETVDLSPPEKHERQ